MLMALQASLLTLWQNVAAIGKEFSRVDFAGVVDVDYKIMLITF